LTNHDFRDQYARAREEQADTLAAKIMTVVDGVEPEPGKVSKARLQFDAYRWHAGKLAPKKYGDHISHNVKGAGSSNFQPQILIQCSSAGDDEGYIDISAAPEAADSLPQQRNGNSLPGSGGRR
jgi:DNA polymerase IIIc chi subunit